MTVMKKEQKNILITDLSKRLSEEQTIYLTDISGLNAAETVELRRACNKSGIKVSVVKNTFLKKAMEALRDKDFGELSAVTKGNTAMMTAKEAGAPAKLIKTFRKKWNKPILKGAYVQESVYIGDDKIDALANIKSKEEVIAEIIGLLQSPAKNVLSALQSGKNKLAGIVKTLSER